MSTTYDRTEVVRVPRAMADVARRRTRALMRAAIFDANALEVLAMSCYMQGLEDALAILGDNERAENRSDKRGA